MQVIGQSFLLTFLHLQYQMFTKGGLGNNYKVHTNKK